MITQPKSKFLVLIICTLLVANLVMLAILIFNGKKELVTPERSNPMTEYLKNEVGFDSSQVTKYEQLSKEHREKSRASFREQGENRKKLLLSLPAAGFSDGAINVIADSMNMRQQVFQVNLLEHLRDIRNLCTPAQRAKFDTGFYKMLVRRPEARKEK